MSDKIKRAERITVQKVLIYWSFVPEFWSKMIVRITGRQLPDKSDVWSHMGIAFELSDGSTQAYEALFDKGFVGPELLENICEKIKTKKGQIVIIESGIKPFYLDGIYVQCKSWAGKLGYYQWQLALMWFYERFGRWVGWKIPKSPDKLVCSEAVARLVWPHLDLRDEIRTGFDEVNPNSAWRKWWKLKQEVI